MAFELVVGLFFLLHSLFFSGITDTNLSVPQEEIHYIPNSPDTLKMVFAGDVMGHLPQIHAAEIEKDKQYDYLPCFQYIRLLISRFDIAAANLELTLPGQPPYTGYPTFRSPDELALGLRQSGFNLLMTANNHSNDGGRPGVFETINTLYKFGFYQTGSFQSQLEKDAYHPLIIYKKGFKLAFLNYTQQTNGIPNIPPTTVNIIEENQIRDDLALTKKMNPDFIIVFLHWGREYQLIENQFQRDLASKMVQWGADLILGAHPHVVQPIRFFNRNGMEALDGEVPVAYSLGNFISNQRKEHTNGGIIFGVDLIKKKQDEKAVLDSTYIIPVFRHIDQLPNGKKKYLVIPEVEFDNHEFDKGLQTQMHYFADNLRLRLGFSDAMPSSTTNFN